MQTLKYDDTKKEYDLETMFPGTELEPVTVDLTDHGETIVLTVGDRPLNLNVQQARDLALALRQMANKASKDARVRMNIK